MILDRYPELKTLSVEEKMSLASELWDNIDPDFKILVDPDLMDEIHRRLDEYHAHPEQVTTWEAIVEKARGSRK